MNKIVIKMAGEKYVLNTSTFENRITYIKNDNKIFTKEIDAHIESEIYDIIKKCENDYIKKFICFSIDKLKSNSKHLTKVPTFVIEFIKNRDKIEQEKVF